MEKWGGRGGCFLATFRFTNKVGGFSYQCDFKAIFHDNQKNTHGLRFDDASEIGKIQV